MNVFAKFLNSLLKKPGISKFAPGAGKMAQQVKPFATKPDDLGSISVTHGRKRTECSK